MQERPTNSRELFPQYRWPVTRVDKPEGTYSIIYGSHDVPQDPKAIPTQIDGLVLESGSTTDWARLSVSFNEQPEFLTYYREKGPQYSSLFPHIEQAGMPLYFLDMSYKTYESLHGHLQLPIVFGETIAGVSLLASASERKSTSRREFLKKGAKVVAGVWLSIPFPIEAANNIEWWIQNKDDTTLQAAALTTSIHPEYVYGPSYPGMRGFDLFMKTSREMVIAHKLEWLMEKLGNKPHIATIIGAGHQGLKDQIETARSDRLSFFQGYQQQLKLAAVLETVYKVARFDYNGSHWQLNNVFEVPELKALVT